MDMKKGLLIWTVALPIVFTGCEKENSTPKENITGNYISDEAGIREIFLLSLNKDNTGTWENYDKGRLQDKINFTWSATSSKLTIKKTSGQSETNQYIKKDNELILGEVTYRTASNKTFTSIVGHTYVAANWQYSTHRRTYEIYTFNQNGSISIEERFDNINGNLYETGYGTYRINGMDIELEINSICDDCFNHFTASMSMDKKMLHL
jgi:hypothetical protein